MKTKTSKMKSTKKTIKKEKPMIRVSKDITNRKLLFTDPDRDDILTLDDPEPFLPSKSSIEETRLSTVVLNAEKLSKQSKEVELPIVTTFRQTIKNIGLPYTNRVPFRTKSSISAINKAWKKESPKFTDLIGVTYLADNYDELRKVANELKKTSESDFERKTGKHAMRAGKKTKLYKTWLKDQKEETPFEVLEFRDFYSKKQKRPDGYEAVHLILKDKRSGKVFEAQLKTKNVKRFSEINHDLYKTNKSDTNEFKALMKIINRADRGDNSAQKELDNMSDSEIKKTLTKKKK